MIVLDASHLIAFFKSDDAHHRAALDVLSGHADDDILVSTVTMAEFLVGPTRSGQLGLARSKLAALGIIEVALPDDAAVRLAQLRAAPGSPKMPDCCVLLAAQVAAEAGGPVTVAAFDGALRTAAVRHGFPVAPTES